MMNLMESVARRLLSRLIKARHASLSGLVLLERTAAGPARICSSVEALLGGEGARLSQEPLCSYYCLTCSESAVT